MIRSINTHLMGKFVVMLALLLVGACQSAPSTTVAPTVASSTTAPSTIIAPTVASTLIATMAVGSTAEDVLRTYLDAYKARDFDKMTAMISDYSLTVLNGKRDDVRASLIKADMSGVRVLDNKILESKTISSTSVMIRVIMSVQGSDQKSIDSWWGLHQNSDGQWQVNASNGTDSLVDDLVLNVPAQTINNVTVQPIHLIRFTNTLALIYALKNSSNRDLFGGWAGAKIATFRFTTMTKDVSGQQALTFHSDQDYPNNTDWINGFYDTWPTEIELSSWQAASTRNPALPDPAGRPWSYTFDIVADTMSATTSQ